MPQWDDLSDWMKIQVMALTYDKEFLTFNIRIHPNLEDRWVAAAADPRAKMRDRVRSELDKAVGTGREFFFIIEGWSKDTNGPTYLHLHGGAAIRAAGDHVKVEAAVARAAGHGQRGFSAVPRAIHSAMFSTHQAAYATYLLKAARRPDPRLPDRRMAVSNSMTQTARLFWESISRPVSEWREPTSI
ncbi:hypothetical protein [Sphingomonas sp. S2-65]|uniref:hypothetical protein n=1 Tax=Sphingomonas sp. S2-65 TaxID=2903960 RepID=UPI001F39E57B|nr:hypothetical protein [Sphingomonas sp. S2-65]UYY59742.1 hypothetical protein LZ586_06560 [Sphingomonas sp. S2-65]